MTIYNTFKLLLYNVYTAYAVLGEHISLPRAHISAKGLAGCIVKLNAVLNRYPSLPPPLTTGYIKRSLINVAANNYIKIMFWKKYFCQTVNLIKKTN